MCVLFLGPRWVLTQSATENKEDILSTNRNSAKRIERKLHKLNTLLTGVRLTLFLTAIVRPSRKISPPTAMRQ